MRKLKYLLFLFIIFLVPNVFAQDIDVTDYCYGNTGFPRMYSGEEVQYQTFSHYNFGTTYQYQLAAFTTELRYNLQANTNYTLTFNANDDDFRNNVKIYRAYDLNDDSNDLVTGFIFVSYRKIQVNFRTTTATDKVKIIVGSNNVYEGITGEVNWNIKNAVLTIPDTPPEEPSGGASNQDIIDNNFQNTQDIINNNNQNTQDIINNNNSNTKTLIDSQKVCNTINKSYISQDNKFLSSNGTILSSSFFGLTDYININNASIEVLQTQTNSDVYYCFYDIDKTKIQCKSNNTLSGILTLPNDAYYVRFSLHKSTDKPQLKICKNGNQVISSALTDSNVDNGTGTDFFDDFTSQDFGLSQIITIPLNTIQSLTSKTCSPLQIPIPFTNSNVTLPCMTELYETKFPTIYNLWKIVSFGIIAYFISVDIFYIVKGFKDPESDKVEVLDL